VYSRTCGAVGRHSTAALSLHSMTSKLLISGFGPVDVASLSRPRHTTVARSAALTLAHFSHRDFLAFISEELSNR